MSFFHTKIHDVWGDLDTTSATTHSTGHPAIVSDHHHYCSHTFHWLQTSDFVFGTRQIIFYDTFILQVSFFIIKMKIIGVAWTIHWLQRKHWRQPVMKSLARMSRGDRHGTSTLKLEDRLAWAASNGVQQVDPSSHVTIHGHVDTCHSTWRPFSHFALLCSERAAMTWQPVRSTHRDSRTIDTADDTRPRFLYQTNQWPCFLN